MTESGPPSSDTQQSQPKGKDAKPIEIPVPKRSAFDKLVKKAAQLPARKRNS